MSRVLRGYDPNVDPGAGFDQRCARRLPTAPPRFSSHSDFRDLCDGSSGGKWASARGGEPEMMDRRERELRHELQAMEQAKAATGRKASARQRYQSEMDQRAQEHRRATHGGASSSRRTVMETPRLNNGMAVSGFESVPYAQPGIAEEDAETESDRSLMSASDGARAAAPRRLLLFACAAG